MAVRGQVESENSSLPVAVRASKTRLLELAKVKCGSETERDLVTACHVVAEERA